MQKLIAQLFNKNLKIECLLFDISLFLYLTAYFFYFQDTAFDARVRLIASASIIITGVNLCRFNMLGISKCAVWYMTFIVFAYISSAWAADDIAAKSIIKTLLRIAIVGFFLQNRIKTKYDVERILDIYVLASIYTCFAILIKMQTLYSLDMLLLTRFGDAVGHNSNSTAMMCAISSTICLFNRKNKFLTWILPIVFFAIIIVICGSKKGIIGLTLGPLVVYTLKNKGQNKKISLFVGIFLASLFFYFITTIPALYDAVGYRLVDLGHMLKGDGTSSQSSLERMELIQQAIEIWYNHFFVGVGMNNFSLFQTVAKGYYAHCNYAELLADLGVIGFLLYYSLPTYILFSKHALQYETFLLKGIVILILFFDTAVVSYQEIQFQIFYWLLAAVTIDART